MLIKFRFCKGFVNRSVERKPNNIKLFHFVGAKVLGKYISYFRALVDIGSQIYLYIKIKYLQSVSTNALMN